RAEDRVDRAVVRHVVTRVCLRRGVPGVEPDRVDAEFREIAQVCSHTGEIADAIAVAVREAARVDLVNDGRTPPTLRGRVVRLPGSDVTHGITCFLVSNFAR